MSRPSGSRGKKFPDRPPEPSVRRWPHTVEAGGDDGRVKALVHYLHCTASYQNQLLSEIKTLLEQLAADRSDDPPAP